MGLKRFTASTVFCLALLLGSGTLFAEEPYQELKKLYESGQLKKAYALAVEMLPAEEGEPQFDFLYGQIAIDSGNVGYGVFALERVLLLNPDNHVARLELARGYFLLGQKDRAKAEFNKVLAVNPPAAVKEKIAIYLQSMNRTKQEETRPKTELSGYYRFTVGHDSNINSASAGDTFSTPTFGTGTLDEDSLARSSLFGKIGFGGRVSRAIDKGEFLFAGVDVEQKINFRKTEYDVGTASIHFGYAKATKDKLFKLTASAQNMELDYNSYLDLINVTAEGQKKLSSAASINGYIRLGTIEYPNLQNRDAYSLSTGFGAVYRGKGRLKPTFSALAYVGRELPMEYNDTSDELADKKSKGIMLKERVSLDKLSTLDFSMLYQKTEYLAEDSVFRVKRADRYLKLGVDYSRKIGKKWTFSANASHSRNTSNISIQEYDRNQVSVSIKRDL